MIFVEIIIGFKIRIVRFDILLDIFGVVKFYVLMCLFLLGFLFVFFFMIIRYFFIVKLIIMFVYFIFYKIFYENWIKYYWIEIEKLNKVLRFLI